MRYTISFIFAALIAFDSVATAPMPNVTSDLAAMATDVVGASDADKIKPYLESAEAKPYIDQYGEQAVALIKGNEAVAKVLVDKYLRPLVANGGVSSASPPVIAALIKANQPLVDALTGIYLKPLLESKGSSSSPQPTTTIPGQIQTAAASVAAAPTTAPVVRSALARVASGATPNFGNFQWSGSIDDYSKTTYGDVESWRVAMLDLTNLARARHAVHALVRDASLEKIAADFMSGGMGMGGNNCFTLADYPSGRGVGSNTWAKAGTGIGKGIRMDLGSIAAWYNEGILIDWSKDVENQVKANVQGLGHFTQLVWKDVTAIGCAYHQCDGSVSAGCIYKAAGNIVGANRFPVQVLPLLSNAPASDRT